MRQPEDTKTIEIFTEEKRGRGRPRVASPMSAAERQRRSRAARRAGSDGEVSLSMMVASGPFFALDRLACHFGVTRQQMLESLIVDADDKLLKSMELDSPAWKQYFNRDKSRK
ncbi:hypothetical protein ACIPF8_17470 [Collimonas sp. NPDC087041]|uniref:hypothetical protein n=1 Tax=Collimonas sp. NPDC087041 TaxID=3363960 RepID=UPI003818CD5E